MARTYIIGDVHGCLRHLDELMVACRIRIMDRVIFIGDLVDKGPDSAAVVRRVRNMSESGWNVTLVEGNHEEMHLRWMRKAPEDRPAMSRHERFAKIHEGLDDGDRAFLATGVPYVKLDGVLVTHAGVPTEIEELPDDVAEIATWSRKQRKYIDRMSRLRYIDAEGKFVSLNDVDLDEHVFWAEKYDGRFGHVIFGHEPYTTRTMPMLFPHATGIDMGCVFGGHLCAMVINPDGSRRFVMVRGTRHAEPWEPLAKKIDVPVSESGP